jgi:tripartite-type tricarboxylate transporter receptor subunit TctC
MQKPDAIRYPVRLALGLAMLLAVGPALGQPSEPAASTRPIRLIVPFAPGGITDILARALAEPVGQRLGASIVVENRTGAGGLLSNEACARAAPDGETLCIGSAATHSLLPYLHPGRLGASPAHFTPISRIGEEPSLIAVRRDHPGHDLPAFLAWAHRQPVVQYGAAGTGGTSHLMTIRMARSVGLNMEPIVYRGGSLVSNALTAGEVPVAIGPVSTFLAGIRAGTLAPVLVMGPNRSLALPNVPTLAETLIPGFGFTAYTGVLGPAGMAPALTERIHAAILDSFRNPTLRLRVESLGFDINMAGPAEFAEWLARTAPEWRGIVEQTRDTVATPSD